MVALGKKGSSMGLILQDKEGYTVTIEALEVIFRQFLEEVINMQKKIGKDVGIERYYSIYSFLIHGSTTQERNKYILELDTTPANLCSNIKIRVGSRENKNMMENYDRYKCCCLHCSGTIRHYNTREVHLLISQNKEPGIAQREIGGYEYEGGLIMVR